MKKFILNGALVLSSLVLTMSCQKTKVVPIQPNVDAETFDFRTDKVFIETFRSDEEVTSNVNKRLNLSELIEIAKIENDEIRKNAYGLLNLPERLDFWEYVTTYNISNGQFSADQKQILIDFKETVVKPNVLANKNLQEVLRVEYLPLIADQLEKAGISLDEMENIFSKGVILNKTTPGSGSAPACNCNFGSRFSCRGCKSTDTCLESSDCGFLWLFYCNGLCS